MSELPPSFDDDYFIHQAIDRAEAEGVVIDDAAARMIASQYHDGQTSAMYSFTSTGAISANDLHLEILHTKMNRYTTDDGKDALSHLSFYVGQKGDRGPVEGWHLLWGRPE